jgi:VWFA-related protein
VAASAPGVAPLREPSGRTVVFVVDDLTLASETLVSLRPVLRDLVRRLDPHDRAAILRTGAVPRQVALISDRDALASQVDALRWNPASGRYKTIEPIEFGLEAQVLGAVGLSPKPGAELEKERQVFHAKNALQLLDLLTTGLAAHPGRKAIVLLSDSLKLQPIGRDLFERLGDRANEASVVVYSLDTRGIQSPTMAADDYVTIPGFQRVQQEELVLRDRDFRDGQSGLREIAEQTGGLAFFNTDPRNALDRTLLDTGGYYLIGYSSEARGDGARRLRKLKVKLKAKGYTVRARRAYFG